MDVLSKDGSFTVHHTNIQTVSLEMYKIKHNLYDSCLNDLFSAANSKYNLRSPSDLQVLGINTVFYGPSSIRYFGSVIWKTLPQELRTLVSLLYSKQQYGDGNHLTVLVGCVKTTWTVLVLSMFQINCTREFMQSFPYFIFCKTE